MNSGYTLYFIGGRWDGLTQFVPTEGPVLHKRLVKEGVEYVLSSSRPTMDLGERTVWVYVPADSTKPQRRPGLRDRMVGNEPSE